MARNAKHQRQARSRKTGERPVSRTKRGPGSPAERSLQLWRSVHDRMMQQQANTHLQGLYAELGKLYFEHLRGAARPQPQVSRHADELSARISAFRQRSVSMGPRQLSKGGKGPPRRRGGSA